MSVEAAEQNGTGAVGLIDRVRAKRFPCREIDEAIFEFAKGRKRHLPTFEQYEPSEKLPEYTFSLDAANSLVPDGWEHWLNTKRKGEGLYWSWGLGHFDFDAVEGERHLVPAMSLCIAALRAIEVERQNAAWVAANPSPKATASPPHSAAPEIDARQDLPASGPSRPTDTTPTQEKE